jgi:uncharacterized protein YdeI (BOF family)
MPDGASATVEGTVTIGLGAIESGRAGFIQDATGGIAIYLDAPATTVLAPATSVRLTGTVDDRYAQRTLRVSATGIVDFGTAPIPAPVAVATGTAGEATEGLRVSIAGTVVEAPSAFADGLGLLVDDGTGPLRVIVGPDALGGLDPARADLVTVVGSLGQRDSSGMGTEGYRVLSMGIGELSLTAAPTPTPTSTATPTPAPTVSSTPGPTDSAGPSPSPDPSPTAATTPPPDPTPTASPGLSPSPSPTPRPTAAPTFPPIAAIRDLPIGTSATVDGVVTVGSGQAGVAALIALGDGSGGIFVRLPAGIVPPARGAHLIVSGVLADPYGQLEVRPVVGGIVPAGAPGPSPTATAVQAAGLGEATEGRLVTLTGVIERRPTSTSAGGLAAILLDDAGGRARIVVSGMSGVTRADLVVGHRYSLTGVVGQRASKKGALDGYRLWVRDRADIFHLGGPAASPTPTPRPSSPPTGSGSGAVVSIARALGMQGQRVSVIGTVTTPSRLLDATGRRIVIQDGTGAIEVRTPTGSVTPGPGRRVRVTGQVVRAYDAPRIKATEITDLGGGTMPSPRSLPAGPSAAVEWQLVRIVGTVLDVHKLGDRWLAQLRVGSARVVVQGRSGTGIPSSALVEGRRATIVGIARRPYPGTADRRFAVLPRSVADIALGGGEPASGASTARSSSEGPEPAPSGRTVGDGTPDPGVTAELSTLADHAGERVKVGGLVVALVADGFTLDDGSAIGRVVLTGEAATFLGLIEPGDAIEATGRAETDADGARLVVDAASDVVRLGSLGESSASPEPSADPAGIGAVGTPSGQRDERPPSRAGFVGSPDATTFVAGWLGLLIGVSAAAGLVRRRRAQRAMAARIAVRLAAIGRPTGPPRA